MNSTSACRCGWNGTGDHPCHRCGTAPGKRRLRHADIPYSLAGAQPKFNMVETWSCDECWAEWVDFNSIPEAKLQEAKREHPELFRKLIAEMNHPSKELRKRARAQLCEIIQGI